MHFLFEPGLWASSPVRTGLLVGTLVAIVTSSVGFFTVMRGQAFAGEALGDMGAAGGSSSYLLGINALWGFVIINLLAASAMELVGVQKVKGRDLATGIVLGVGFSLAALFLYIGTTFDNVSGAPVTILFGSLFVISSSTIPLVLGLCAIVLSLLVFLHRPLLLCSFSPDLAQAKGLPVRLIGFAYLVAMALTVALAALTIGAILSTALLVGPAAASFRLAKSPKLALVLASLLAILSVWIGVVLAYDSYDWGSAHHGWPVSFFVVAIIVAFYGVASMVSWLRERSTNVR